MEAGVVDDYRLPCLGECFGDWLAVEIPSESEPGLRYLPIFNFLTGEAECNCQSFQRWGQERPCKHIRSVIMSSTQLAKAAVPDIASILTEQARYDALVQHRETIARTVMPSNATPAQVNAFLLLCSKYALDPFTGEAWAFAKPGGGIQFMPGYRAYLRRAQEHPEFEFLRFGVVFRGEKCSVNLATGEVSHEALFDDASAEPFAVWWQAKRKDQAAPVAGRIFLKNVNRPNSPAWKDNPVQMLRKSALTEACLTVFGLVPPLPSQPTGNDEDYIDIVPEDAGPVDPETGERLDSPLAERGVSEVETQTKPEPCDNPPAQPSGEPAVIDAEIVGEEGKVWYWHHPESSCVFTTAHPLRATGFDAGLCEELTLEEYEGLKARYESGKSAGSVAETVAAPAGPETSTSSPSAVDEPFGQEKRPQYDFNSAQKIAFKEAHEKLKALDPHWDKGKFLIQCQRDGVTTADCITKMLGLVMKWEAAAKEKAPAEGALV